ncbi:hypothetical protein BLA60_07090 [Actinophytocola xinjiangensis]|uniref:Uncharacterized protein n=1 Tax=Actinophytocola xinjiangensis TaxID=485602 RepID=A0A7Z1B0H7_9PSEU|nr:DUF6187 family protein [Actinophytocola xinjiangensis]OLF13208.1 hypothetical protein BLA60_07090 [Actinophytocola xinjiangensis]
MRGTEPYDTVFSLPSVDDDAETEIGVLLMGLGPERLLAGLGVACLRGDAGPAEVTLVVDQLRHDAGGDLALADALRAGAARWRVAHAALAGVVPGVRSASLRQQLAAASAEITGIAGSPAQRLYLVVCWLRCAEITRTAEEHGVFPELPS